MKVHEFSASGLRFSAAVPLPPPGLRQLLGRNLDVNEGARPQCKSAHPKLQLGGTVGFGITREE